MRGAPPVPGGKRRAVLKMFTAFAAVIGAATALIGVIFGLRQLSLQAKAAKLDVLIVINENWKNRKNIALDRTDRTRWTSETPLDPETQSVAVRALALSDAEPLATTSDPLLDPVPFALLLLSPTWSDGAEGAPRISTPRNEREYIENLKWRCKASFIVYETFSRPDAGDGPRQAFARLSLMAERYVSEMNDIAELVEARIMDPVDFLRKRHYAVMREAYVVEPFILWRSSQPAAGRWGMRVLALAAAARAFHWSDPLHCGKDVEALGPRERAAFTGKDGTWVAPQPLISANCASRRLAPGIRQDRLVSSHFSSGYRDRQNVLLTSTREILDAAAADAAELELAPT